MTTIPTAVPESSLKWKCFGLKSHAALRPTRPRRTLVFGGTSIWVIIVSTKASNLPCPLDHPTEAADSEVKSRLSTGREQEIIRQPARHGARGKIAASDDEASSEFRLRMSYLNRGQRARPPSASPSCKENHRLGIRWRAACRNCGH